MAFVLLIVGLLMIVTGSKGTYAQFGQQVANDFTGEHNFTYWIAAIGGVGALGYVESLRTVSRLFMALIIIAMVLANKGFFAQFAAALKSGPVAPVLTGQSKSATIEEHQSGAAGQPATSEGQAKFNGWMNYFLGIK